jgi:hypothetical protein
MAASEYPTRRATLHAMLALALLSAALAVPLGSPVADDEYGFVRVSGSLAAEGTIKEMAGLPARTVRVDVVPWRHVGVFADGTWVTAASTSVEDGRDRGWRLGGGARGVTWLSRTLAVAAAGRLSYGPDWTTVPGGDATDRSRDAQGTISPSVVLGAEGGGAYLWAGPAYSIRGTRSLSPGAGGWDWSDAGGRFGGELGGELHSGDLLSQGLRRHLYASTGFSVHLRDRPGLSLWVGFAW